MDIMFRAIDENYKMAMQYKYAWNRLLMSGQIRDKRIWKNFTYFVDWMNDYFNKENLCEMIGKSYNLDDYVLCRIPGQTWLMSNIFRHVENPRIEKFPEQKYVGKVKFTKIFKKANYAGAKNEEWTPPKKNENGDDIEERKSVDDIQIVVYDDMEKPRRYELEYGWKDEWIEQGICDLQQAPKLSPETEEIYYAYREFEKFRKKWTDLNNKNRVPKWYMFNPENPEEIADDHNMMKKWDKNLFDFLEEQKWMERIPSSDQYEEKSEFVVNCSQLLGIGGEGILIRKSITERVGGTTESTSFKNSDRRYDALKIIPINLRNLTEKDQFKSTKELENEEFTR